MEALISTHVDAWVSLSNTRVRFPTPPPPLLFCPPPLILLYGALVGGGTMRTVALVCDGCGVSFEKAKNEVTRQLKKNPDRKFYCKMTCYAVATGSSNLGEHLSSGRPEFLDAGNRQDKLSSFRYYMNKARNRKMYNGEVRPHDIDLPYLKELWESQKGLCALSGMVMDLPRNSLEYAKRPRVPWKPSLDRIDCSQGYMKGNVRFIVAMANLCRSIFSDDDVVTFCKAVTEKQKNC
jgi:hypothetical protein